MPSDTDAEDQSWRPNLFVPGFPKCGTTALCDYLRQHPDVFVSEPKEPNTLAIGTEYPRWRKKHSIVMRPFTRYLDPGDYRRLFEERKLSKYRAEGSQTYIWPPLFPQRLKQFAPDAKLLFMIREPKERLLSLYYHGFKIHLEPDFAKWIERRFRPQAGLFLVGPMLASYHRLFGGSMRVIENRTLLQSPQDVMGRVFGFLGLGGFEVAPIRSNVEEMRGLDAYQRKRAAPYLRLTKTVMTPAKYFLNTADPGSKWRIRRQAGRLSLWRWFGGRGGGGRPSRPLVKSSPRRLGEPIPNDLAEAMDEDYRSALEFCRGAGLLIEAEGSPRRQDGIHN